MWVMGTLAWSLFHMSDQVLRLNTNAGKADVGMESREKVQGSYCTEYAFYRGHHLEDDWSIPRYDRHQV